MKLNLATILLLSTSVLMATASNHFRTRQIHQTNEQHEDKEGKGRALWAPDVNPSFDANCPCTSEAIAELSAHVSNVMGDISPVHVQKGKFFLRMTATIDDLLRWGFWCLGPIDCRSDPKVYPSRKRPNDDGYGRGQDDPYKSYEQCCCDVHTLKEAFMASIDAIVHLHPELALTPDLYYPYIVAILQPYVGYSELPTMNYPGTLYEQCYYLWQAYYPHPVTGIQVLHEDDGDGEHEEHEEYEEPEMKAAPEFMIMQMGTGTGENP